MSLMNNLSSGILSRELKYRFDLEKRGSGLEKLVNGLPQTTGGITKRFGTEFLSDLNFVPSKDKETPFVDLGSPLLQNGVAYVSGSNQVSNLYTPSLGEVGTVPSPELLSVLQIVTIYNGFGVVMKVHSATSVDVKYVRDRDQIQVAYPNVLEFDKPTDPKVLRALVNGSLVDFRVPYSLAGLHKNFIALHITSDVAELHVLAKKLSVINWNSSNNVDKSNNEITYIAMSCSVGGLNVYYIDADTNMLYGYVDAPGTVFVKSFSRIPLTKQEYIVRELNKKETDTATDDCSVDSYSYYGMLIDNYTPSHYSPAELDIVTTFATCEYDNGVCVTALNYTTMAWWTFGSIGYHRHNQIPFPWGSELGDLGVISDVKETYDATKLSANRKFTGLLRTSDVKIPRICPYGTACPESLIVPTQIELPNTSFENSNFVDVIDYRTLNEPIGDILFSAPWGYGVTGGDDFIAYFYINSIRIINVSDPLSGALIMSITTELNQPLDYLILNDVMYFTTIDGTYQIRRFGSKFSLTYWDITKPTGIAKYQFGLNVYSVFAIPDYELYVRNDTGEESHMLVGDATVGELQCELYDGAVRSAPSEVGTTVLYLHIEFVNAADASNFIAGDLILVAKSNKETCHVVRQVLPNGVLELETTRDIGLTPLGFDIEPRVLGNISPTTTECAIKPIHKYYSFETKYVKDVTANVTRGAISNLVFIDDADALSDGFSSTPFSPATPDTEAVIVNRGVGFVYSYQNLEVKPELTSIPDTITFTAETGETSNQTERIYTCIGPYNVTTGGVWSGSVRVYSRLPVFNSAWELVHTISSSSDRNESLDGEVYEIGTELKIVIEMTNAGTSTSVPGSVRINWDNGLLRMSPKQFIGSNNTIYDTFSVASESYLDKLSFKDGRIWASQEDVVLASGVDDFNSFKAFGLFTDISPRRFQLADERINRIAWIISMGEDLVIGTNSAIWAIKTNKEGKYYAVRQSSVGTSPIQPLVVGGELVFVSYDKKRLIASVFDIQTNSLVTNELTSFCGEITDGIRSVTYDERNKLIYITTTNQLVYVMNYYKQQNVLSMALITLESSSISFIDDETYLVLGDKLYAFSDIRGDYILRNQIIPAECYYMVDGIWNYGFATGLDRPPEISMYPIKMDLVPYPPNADQAIDKVRRIGNVTLLADNINNPLINGHPISNISEIVAESGQFRLVLQTKWDYEDTFTFTEDSPFETKVFGFNYALIGIEK